MKKNAIFWEDYTQARERLNGTHILHNYDVVGVAEINAPPRGSKVPTMLINRYPGGKAELLQMDDPGFHRFRRLPPMGWTNYEAEGTALYLDRRPVRRTSHGLSDNNVSVGHLAQGAVRYSDYRFRHVATDAGYGQAAKNDFPAMDDVLLHIRENSTLAVESRYAVHRDDAGIKWLMRQSKRVGLFPSNDSLILLGKYAFLREELVEAPTITVANIQGF